jgi:uncharacterized membrane protein YhaH (DUF805 family)
MTFVDAIQTCFKKYVDFKGRAGKSECWWWILFFVVVSAGLSAVNQQISALFSLATFLPSIAVATRRLHDTDKSGWFQLIALVPVLGLVIIYFLIQDSKEPNRFGASTAQQALSEPNSAQ